MIDLIMEKNKDPEIAAKRIHISYLITNEKSYFKIKDEGKGFDWHYQMSREEDEPSSIPIPFPASWKPLKWFILPTSRLCAAKMSPVRPVLYCVWSLCGICRKNWCQCLPQTICSLEKWHSCWTTDGAPPFWLLETASFCEFLKVPSWILSERIPTTESSCQSFWLSVFCDKLRKPSSCRQSWMN